MHNGHKPEPPQTFTDVLTRIFNMVTGKKAVTSIAPIVQVKGAILRGQSSTLLIAPGDEHMPFIQREEAAVATD